MGNTDALQPDHDRSSVHPHTHGEHHPYVLVTCDRIGSSPHAWGTRYLHLRLPFCRRFIPTRMGNTHACRMDYRHTPVHPHTHGEHIMLSLSILSYIGSSPHAWGTPVSTAGRVPRSRFIPTRMGNTDILKGVCCHHSVHPHTHGEHAAGIGGYTTSTGSSPHAWGTHCQWGR